MTLTKNIIRFGLPLLALVALPAMSLASETATGPIVKDMQISKKADKSFSESIVGFNSKFKVLENIHFSVFKKYSDVNANAKFDGLKKRQPTNNI